MRKIFLLITIIIGLFEHLNSQNLGEIRLKIGQEENESYIITTDKTLLARSFEKALNLKDNSIENIDLKKVKDGVVSLGLYLANNRKISFPTLINGQNIEIVLDRVTTYCDGELCNGCCPIVEVCTECIRNGSENPGTCTRKVVGPVYEHFVELLQK